MQHYVFYNSHYLTHHVRSKTPDDLHLVKSYLCDGSCLDNIRQEKTTHLLFTSSLKNFYHNLRSDFSSHADSRLYHTFLYLLYHFCHEENLKTDKYSNHAIHFVTDSGMTIKCKKRQSTDFNTIKTLAEKIEKDMHRETIIRKYLNTEAAELPFEKLTAFITRKERIGHHEAAAAAETIKNYHRQNYEAALQNNESRIFDFFIRYKVADNDPVRILLTRNDEMNLTTRHEHKAPFFLCTHETRAACPMQKNAGPL